MLFCRGTQGASKNPLGSFQLHGVLELWPPKVSSLLGNKRDGRTKNAISRDFWHFFNFDVFLKGEPRGTQKPKRDLPNRCGTRDMAVESPNFTGKCVGRPNKNHSFLRFWIITTKGNLCAPVGPSSLERGDRTPNAGRLE